MQFTKQTKLIVKITGIFLILISIQSYANSSSVPNTTDFAKGAIEWSNNCARCHNPRSPTEFTPPQWQTIMQHMRIQAGITGQEARDILAFLQSESAAIQQAPLNNTQIASAQINPITVSSGAVSGTTNNVEANTKQIKSGLSGRSVYQTTCVACHGANGKGAVPGAPDFHKPNGVLNQSDSVLLDHIINGYQSKGSPMAMPPRGGNSKLTDSDLKNALNYIRKKFGK